MLYQIAVFLALLMSPSAQAVVPVTNGGTGYFELTNNLIEWGIPAAGGNQQQINGQSYLLSTGPNLTIGQSGVSTSSEHAPAKFNLHGTDSSQGNGPHLQTYTSTDAFPIMQFFNYKHDSSAICFDCYTDGSNYFSSSSGSNFAILKNSAALHIKYASGVTASTTNPISSFPDALSISNAGATTFGGSIYLPTSASGATASGLNYYEDYTLSTTTSAGDGESTVSSVGVSIRFIRVGGLVTAVIPATSGIVIGAGLGNYVDLASLPSRFAPAWPSQSFIVQIGTAENPFDAYLVVGSSSMEFQLFNGTEFPTNSNFGWPRDIVLSYAAD